MEALRPEAYNGSPEIHQPFMPIASTASDPLQYDRDDLIWTAEGRKDNFNRQLYLEALRPTLREIGGKRVLEIGCGQGWLCDEIVRHGGEAVGIEPSAKNIQASRDKYPKLRVEHTSLEGFRTDERFDTATAIMVLEHFLDLEEAMRKIAVLLESSGRFIAIVGDFDKFTVGRKHRPMETEPLARGEVATRVDYGERVGILCDIVRTIDRYDEIATRAGLTLSNQTPLLPKPGHPRYETHKGKPLFHLLEFAKK